MLKAGKDDISSDGSSTFVKAYPTPDQSPLAALMLPVEEIASCHFISNYILIPRQGTTRGYMEYLLPLIKAETKIPHFKLAYDACALASLGNRTGSGNGFQEQALIKYTKALSMTFHALKDPELSKTDATLASVLLLGLFENITAKQIGTLAWGSHIDGAVQLVKQRGRKQLRTKNGLILFIAVRTQMVSVSPLQWQIPSHLLLTTQRLCIYYPLVNLQP